MKQVRPLLSETFWFLKKSFFLSILRPDKVVAQSKQKKLEGNFSPKETVREFHSFEKTLKFVSKSTPSLVFFSFLVNQKTFENNAKRFSFLRYDIGEE